MRSGRTRSSASYAVTGSSSDTAACSGQSIQGVVIAAGHSIRHRMRTMARRTASSSRCRSSAPQGPNRNKRLQEPRDSRVRSDRPGSPARCGRSVTTGPALNFEPSAVVPSRRNDWTWRQGRTVTIGARLPTFSWRTKGRDFAVIHGGLACLAFLATTYWIVTGPSPLSYTTRDDVAVVIDGAHLR